MQLTLTKSIPSPLGKKPLIIWTLNNEGAFLISDSWNMVRLDTDGSVNVLWRTTDKENAYQFGSVYDDRVSDPFYEGIREAGISGFQLLNVEDYLKIHQGNKYHPNFRPVPLKAHDSVLLYLEEKEIALLKAAGSDIVKVAKVKVKGKGKTAEMLHPAENVIVYGTNYGELYAQPFDAEGFEKTVKIDQLPNVCYQIAFAPNGRKMFAVGMGYLKIYDYHEGKFTAAYSLSTAARSFELIDDYMIFNKGMHGIDILRVAGKPESLSSLDLPFSIDRMVYLASTRTFLLTSANSDDLHFLQLVD
ncbi:hypothetical protein SAMN04487996_10275 [Dyadobacter soli]|uniref:WD40-like Beta Propeller Repeat n=1 Tax=Dyadobacter soli TaxID=659014 RepID=A0A1G6X6I2_9BACT|nr:hypothetical protein [Dyadobacter soli]SDD73684.1 hypothetical protein SAMN04487996_10275 [Dyadobacter soli]